MKLEEGNDIEMTESVIQQKLFSAESYSAPIRLVIVLINTVAYYLLMDKSLSIPWLANLIIGTALFYSFYLVVFKPFERVSLRWTSYLTFIADGAFVGIWIIATGYSESPFYLLWYVSIIAVGQRFSFNVTIFTSLIYALTYVVILRIDIGAIASAEMFLRVLYIPITGALAAFFSSEFENQVEDKLRARRSEMAALSAQAKQEELLEQLRQTQKELERRVAERTGDLQALNEELKHEIAEKEGVQRSQRQILESLERTNAEVEKLLWVVSKTDNSMAVASEKGLIEWVNEGFERLTGYGFDAVAGTHGDILVKGAPSGLNPKSQHFKELVATKRSVTYESKNYTKNGQEFWVLTTITPIIGSDGEIQKIITIDSDISDRKKAETELLFAKRKAEKLAKTKEEFLTNLSHELRTPMNAIIGVSQLLEDTRMTKKQQSYLKALSFASDNLLNIINDVLDLSKIESGQIEYESVPFDLNQMIQDVGEMFSFRAKEKDLQFHVKTEGIPGLVIGDPSKLNQILLNLLSNAFKFTDKGAVFFSITLLEQQGSRSSIQFQIRDTGIGIPKEKQGVIFESFKQAESTITRKFGGTGLGLTIVKKLVDGLGGTLQVQSELHKGATFTICIPFGVVEHTAPPTPESLPENDRAKLKGKRCLLVEDNELNQMVVCEFLGAAEMEVETAENGNAALATIEKTTFDIVLMDIQMPEMDGYEAAKELRKRGFKKPILAMTAHALSGEIEKCSAAGMDDCLTKPIKRHVLYSKIAQLLSNDRD